ncbi:(2Fe-2S)-binding protein [Rhodoplanes elegans]|uniref:(2Fe-2S)-binding protein n=1 Tax=Rhodoplanes elegans TaxID=29408 RepID=A0A327KJ66_9BRAD|nr:aromatic ring-hydroxylating dioxygenase subunit alpha [Rhodoplanes elegans]MBK5960416.1 (2Fe-2S)-binding protein [Rhodoplanes elegans]RAI38810.1 (2Fe-2S)-binding protein [Rhodoplanes elegans]
MSTDLKDRIERRINQGLLGQWYAAAKSVQVKPGRPHGVAILGRNLVLWRDAAGKVKCLEDFCPHRGAKLSRGEVHEGNIACRYHGVILDGTGTIVQVPAMPECALEGRRAIESFTVHEMRDCVFVYMPSAERPTAPPFQAPAEFLDEAWEGFLCMSRWGCNYRYALDNLADPMHGCYLHAQSFTLAYGAKQDLMKLDRTDDGFVVSRVQQQGENFDWTHMVVTEAQTYCRLDIPYPKAAGPGSVFRIIGFTTPIDETHCYVFFWRMRKIDGLARQAWRFLYRAMLEERHWHVLEQDREMLEDMPDDARMREMLYQHDIGVSRMRQMLTRAAKAQIAAEDAAASRTAV